MRRREFIASIGTIAACSLAARAQQPNDQMRRIGILMPFAQNDAENHTRVQILQQETAKAWLDRGPQYQVRRALDHAGHVRQKVPAIFNDRAMVTNGGLTSYGVDRSDLFRRAASYVDRILRGEKPDDLPFQLPTKYELVINRRTANALGLDIPENLLALADEVIE